MPNVIYESLRCHTPFVLIHLKARAVSWRFSNSGLPAVAPAFRSVHYARPSLSLDYFHPLIQKTCSLRADMAMMRMTIAESASSQALHGAVQSVAEYP